MHIDKDCRTSSWSVCKITETEAPDATLHQGTGSLRREAQRIGLGNGLAETPSRQCWCSGPPAGHDSQSLNWSSWGLPGFTGIQHHNATWKTSALGEVHRKIMCTTWKSPSELPPHPGSGNKPPSWSSSWLGAAISNTYLDKAAQFDECSECSSAEFATSNKLNAAMSRSVT